MEDNNFMEVLKENKGKIIFLIICIALSIVFSILGKSIDNKKNKLDVKSTVEELAKVYYEKSYYPNMIKDYLSDRSFLEHLNDTGIRLNLRTLVQGVEDIDASVFYSDDNYCNFVNTYVIIYPINPYGVEDYKYETNIDCSNSFIVGEENE